MPFFFESFKRLLLRVQTAHPCDKLTSLVVCRKLSPFQIYVILVFKQLFKLGAVGGVFGGNSSRRLLTEHIAFKLFKLGRPFLPLGKVCLDGGKQLFYIFLCGKGNVRVSHAPCAFQSLPVAFLQTRKNLFPLVGRPQKSVKVGKAPCGTRFYKFLKSVGGSKAILRKLPQVAACKPAKLLVDALFARYDLRLAVAVFFFQRAAGDALGVCSSAQNVPFAFKLKLHPHVLSRLVLIAQRSEQTVVKLVGAFFEYIARRSRALKIEHAFFLLTSWRKGDTVYFHAFLRGERKLRCEFIIILLLNCLNFYKCVLKSSLRKKCSA